MAQERPKSSMRKALTNRLCGPAAAAALIASAGTAAASSSARAPTRSDADALTAGGLAAAAVTAAGCSSRRQHAIDLHHQRNLLQTHQVQPSSSGLFFAPESGGSHKQRATSVSLGLKLAPSRQTPTHAADPEGAHAPSGRLPRWYPHICNHASRCGASQRYLSANQPTQAPPAKSAGEERLGVAGGATEPAREP